MAEATRIAIEGGPDGLYNIVDDDVRMMTEQRGSSNAKAKRLMGWQPIWASWRDGFHRALAPGRAA